MQEIFDDMVAEAQECNTFVDRSRDLLGIWYQSAIVEGQIILRHAETSLSVSEATYEKYVFLLSEKQFDYTRK